MVKAINTNTKYLYQFIRHERYNERKLMLDLHINGFVQ